MVFAQAYPLHATYYAADPLTKTLALTLTLTLRYGRLAGGDDREQPLTQLEQRGVRDPRGVAVGRRRGALRVR